MKIGDRTTTNGNGYVAIAYRRFPADFFPTDDDQQCRICQLAPNFCKMMDDCHGIAPFVFVKADIFDAMKTTINL